MSLPDWLRAASAHIGGPALARRQVNVFCWHGRAPDANADSGSGEAAEAAGGRSAPRPWTLVSSLSSPPPPAAYSGHGAWRAATIRAYHPDSAAFELKYHDEGKGSTSYIWLPLAVVHFARNPPTCAASVRCLPEGVQPIPAFAALQPVQAHQQPVQHQQQQPLLCLQPPPQHQHQHQQPQPLQYQQQQQLHCLQPSLQCLQPQLYPPQSHHSAGTALPCPPASPPAVTPILLQQQQPALHPLLQLQHQQHLTQHTQQAQQPQHTQHAQHEHWQTMQQAQHAQQTASRLVAAASHSFATTSHAPQGRRASSASSVGADGLPATLPPTPPPTLPPTPPAAPSFPPPPAHAVQAAHSTPPAGAAARMGTYSVQVVGLPARRPSAASSATRAAEATSAPPLVPAPTPAAPGRKRRQLPRPPPPVITKRPAVAVRPGGGGARAGAGAAPAAAPGGHGAEPQLGMDAAAVAEGRGSSGNIAGMCGAPEARRPGLEAQAGTRPGPPLHGSPSTTPTAHHIQHDAAWQAHSPRGSATGSQRAPWDAHAATAAATRGDSVPAAAAAAPPHCLRHHPPVAAQPACAQTRCISTWSVGQPHHTAQVVTGAAEAGAAAAAVTAPPAAPRMGCAGAPTCPAAALSTVQGAAAPGVSAPGVEDDPFFMELFAEVAAEEWVAQHGCGADAAAAPTTAADAGCNAPAYASGCVEGGWYDAIAAPAAAVVLPLMPHQGSSCVPHQGAALYAIPSSEAPLQPYYPAQPICMWPGCGGASGGAALVVMPSDVCRSLQPACCSDPWVGGNGGSGGSSCGSHCPSADADSSAPLSVDSMGADERANAEFDEMLLEVLRD